jgi:hypothetical protein
MNDELIAVETFRSTADAEVAQGLLDEAGIESLIRSDNAGGMYPGIDGAVLLVRVEAAEQARNALRHATSGTSDPG